MTTKRRGAELVFIEREFNGRGLPGWDGRLVNPNAMDRKTGRRAEHFIASIRYAKPYGAMDEGYGKDAAIIGHLRDGSPVYAEHPYLVTMQGNHPGGRRYSRHATLRGAQKQLIDWARRRFYVPESHGCWENVVHKYDPRSRLRDSYWCGECGRLLQVG